MDMEEWIQLMQGYIMAAWERRKEADDPWKQKYWSAVIRALKQDIQYEIWRKGYRGEENVHY